jgi:hypothetical protein
MGCDFGTLIGDIGSSVIISSTGLVHAAEMVGEGSCVAPAAGDGDGGWVVDAAGVA